VWRLMAALVICVSVGLAIVMAIAWLMQRWTGNDGWVDAVWSFGLGYAGVAYALCPLRGQMPTARQWLVALLVAAWSLPGGSAPVPG
jgi:steroid 5-alpha reductase family enzyme